MYNLMPQQNKNISLYQESQAKDNCGFGLIVNRHGIQNRDVVKRSIAGLTSMTHRGAIGADGKTGDGCGLLFDLNQAFFQRQIKKELNIKLPELFGVAQIFSSAAVTQDLPAIKKILKLENLILECVREVPINPSVLGKIACESLPKINQIFITPIQKILIEKDLSLVFFRQEKKLKSSMMMMKSCTSAVCPVKQLFTRA